MQSDDILEIENLKCNESSFVIRWDMTKLCNYYCDFCIQGNKNTHLKESHGESKEIRNITCKKIIKFIEEELNGRYESVCIHLIGGEVTILQDFIPILERIVNCKFKGKIRFQIMTNLSTDKKTLRKIKDIFLEKDNRSLNLSCTFYKEFTTEKAFMSKIKCLTMDNIGEYIYLKRKYSTGTLKKIYKKLYSRFKHRFEKYPNIHISIKYPLICDKDYQRYKKFKNKYQFFLRNPNSIRYLVIRDYKNTISDDLIKKLPSKTDKKIRVTLKSGEVQYYYNTSTMLMNMHNREFNPNGFLCDSGIHNISIDNIGNIYRCPTCKEETMLGNVMNSDIKLIEDKLICPSKRCYCDYYHKIKNNKC